MITFIRDCCGLIAEAEFTAIYMESRFLYCRVHGERLALIVFLELVNRASTWGMAGFDELFAAMPMMCFLCGCLRNRAYVGKGWFCFAVCRCH